jgi:hypothetical protein
VLVDGNVFDANWPHAQNGFAILFTVRNQDGGSPWSTVEDVIFQNNLVQHVASGINIRGTDDIHPSQPARRIAILNNLFIDVGGHWGARRAPSAPRGSERCTYRPQHSPSDRHRHVRRRTSAE